MKNPFTALFRARDKPRDSVSAAPVFYFGTSGAGKSVTAQTAIQLSTRRQIRHRADSHSAFHGVCLCPGNLGNGGQPAAGRV